MMLSAPPLPGARACVFLDVDGTLVDFAETPDRVHVDEALLELLAAAMRKVDGALALISGRCIADLDRLFAPLVLPAAGVHGLERRDTRGTLHRSAVAHEALQPIRAYLQALVACRAELVLEDKQGALALHFRRAPQEENLVRRALSSVMPLLPAEFELLEGNKVIEIKPTSRNKASAVEAFMREPAFADRTPIFIGDDHTDLDGFAAVERYGGMAIAVGNRIAARWTLSSPAAVREWLSSFVRSFQS